MVAQTVWSWDAIIAALSFPAAAPIGDAYADFQAHPEWDMPGMSTAQQGTFLAKYRAWLIALNVTRLPSTLTEALNAPYISMPSAQQTFVFNGQVGTTPPPEPEPEPEPEPPYAGPLPEWLHNFLMAFNITILTWDINAGDAIETALSWVVGVIDGVRDLAQSGLDLAQAAWDHALEVVTAALVDPLASIAALWAWTETLPTALADWWATTSGYVLDWIYAVRDDLQAQINGLLSFDWFSSWWGYAESTFDDWWDMARGGVLAAIEVIVKPIRDLVNEHTSTLKLLTSPGDTALRWLMDRIETALARLW